MAIYQAVYDYKNMSSGMLSFRCGDKFTVKKKTNDDWWEVEDKEEATGLVPVSYLELVEGEEERDGAGGAGGGDGGGAGGGGGGDGGGGVFTAVYDFIGADNTQLTFKKGEQFKLEIKTDNSWWTMKSFTSGLSGYVPVNYIDVPAENAVNLTQDTSTASPSNHGDSKPHLQQGGLDESEALTEVLLSVDRAIQKIHDEATLQGGSYTSQQRATLQQLATHRRSVVEENNTVLSQQPQQHQPDTHTTTSSSSSSSTSPSNKSPHHLNNTTPTTTTMATNTHSHHTSPRPKRKAPAPPTNYTPQFSSLPRRSKDRKSRSRENLLEVQKSVAEEGSHRDRSMTQPQHSGVMTSRSRSDSQPSLIQNGTTSRPLSHTASSGERKISSPASPQRSKVNPSSPQKKKVSEEVRGRGVQRTQSSISTPSLHSSRDSTGRSTAVRTMSADVVPPSATPTATPTSPSHQPRRPAPVRTSSSIGIPEEKKITLPPGLSPKASPLAQRKLVSMSSLPDKATPTATPTLPTQFPSSDGADLIEVVRARTQLSYNKSVQAVTGILETLRDKLPQSCTATMDGLISSVHLSQAKTSPSAARKMDNSSDMTKLKEIFFQLREVKEDSQQRGWAVHDDLTVIMEYLKQLLQILCDADQQVTRVAVREDKYENILILISYYDIEPRIPIRLLMLQVFGILCGLDREVISILLGSILPNELGRDINNQLSEIEKTLYSCTVCTMIFSTGEPVPLSVYDQWDENYISFLLDTIENPPEEDRDEQLPDAFLNVILSFNQHFTDPETNAVMNVLKTKQDPRHFSEKLMFLINRGDDPVSLGEPLCPDSLTKFALDIFSSKETSGLFYTTDLMVLIDIVLRQISDLCPGDKIRSHYLELLNRMVGSTDYKSHCHRQKEITVVLNRISQEEGEDSLSDKDIIRKLWTSHPGCFEEVTDL